MVPVAFGNLQENGGAIEEVEGKTSQKPRGAFGELVQPRKALRTADLQSRELASKAVGS